MSKLSFENFIFLVGLEEGQKFNSCHKPPGGSDGGQFCSSGTAGGGGAALGLARLSEMAGGEEITVIPQADVQEFMNKIKGKEKVKSETVVPIGQLQGQQPVVSRARVGRYIENFDQSRYNENLPIVLRYRNQYVVLDGHHKLSALKLMGETEARAQVTQFFD